MHRNSFRPRSGIPVRSLTLALAVLLGALCLPVRAAEPEDEAADVQDTVDTAEVQDTAEATPLPTEPEPVGMEPLTVQSAPALLADSAEDPNYILVEKTFQEHPPACFWIMGSYIGR